MTSRTFDDHFSPLAATYVNHRPSYPEELFELLAAAAPSRGAAWDAGTGSGQAAARLGNYFDEVIGTDPSAAQIEHAVEHPNVTYRVEVAEETSFEANRFDLVTSAQAAHWFRIDDFYTEVHRVLKPGGVLALWCYGLETISEDVDEVTNQLYVEKLGPYWPRRTLPDHTYQDIPFPFEELPRRVLRMEMHWTLDGLLSGFRTWSAVHRYREEHGRDPVDELEPAFRAAWGDTDEPRRVRWPVYLRYGVSAGS